MVKSDAADQELRRAVGIRETAEVAEALHFVQIHLSPGRFYRVTRLRMMTRKMFRGGPV
jgi:hypothetical protein